MKNIVKFLKEHYPVLLLVVLPPMFLLGGMNENFKKIVMNVTLVLGVLMGIAFFVGLLLLSFYIISLYIKWIKNDDLDSFVLAIKWTLGVSLFIVLVIYGDVIDNFLF